MNDHTTKFGETAREINLLLNDFEKVKTFCRMNEKLNGDVTILSERWVINGKSIMGLHSLDLRKEIKVVVECETAEKSDEYIEILRKTFA